ncbi:hypothetical protein B0293_07725 [Amycolatopsis azurea DSM 43854]|uniref:Uncharacterized protein n=1 Tax=Amycolatopsis azurea DSM 43854 TaxID=1238180 RepID=M2QUG8_9PSEU|nr:hypothetical protein C791_2991 [Amycolatopsis azurea DSM 43854]OOC07548.1 hypothetical protein B0293_07725 [Amycolatopsis azurea DSM 43854]
MPQCEMPAGTLPALNAASTDNVLIAKAISNGIGNENLVTNPRNSTSPGSAAPKQCSSFSDVSRDSPHETSPHAWADQQHERLSTAFVKPAGSSSAQTASTT